jgi:hypothetical protein
MGFIQKYVKKVRNLFHIPGEDVILLGLDDRNKSFRIFDLFVKTGSKFESKMESKVVEGNVAQVFLWYTRKKIEHIFEGEYDPFDPNILHVHFTIDKREGCIFKTEDKPEGIAYLVDMQTGQGAQLIRSTETKVVKELYEDAETEEIVTAKEVYQIDNTSIVTVPHQVKLHRDPVIDMLVSINPYFWGSTIDSFIATELLRGRVEMWKTILIAAVIGVFCLIIGMGMK